MVMKTVVVIKVAVAYKKYSFYIVRNYNIRKEN